LQPDSSSQHMTLLCFPTIAFPVRAHPALSSGEKASAREPMHADPEVV
jgi:hypothetical protein